MSITHSRPASGQCARPDGDGGAEERHELAPFQLIDLHSMPCPPDCRLPNFSVTG